LYIYKVTNNINDRPYIGQRKGKFDPEYLGSGLLIKRAINKYGKHSFKLEILAQANTKREIDKLEKEYIAFYRQKLGSKKLYNLAEGGQGGGGLKIHKKECECGWCQRSQGKLRGNKSPLWIKRETRICECGCNRKFRCKIDSIKKFILGHSFVLIKSAWNKGQKERVELVCECCKRVFKVIRSQSNHRYCSRKCYHKQPIWNKNLTSKTDSRVAKYGKKLKGSGNANWKSETNYFEQRKKVYK
jgi:hypothetical protein